MIGPFGRQGPAAALGQQRPQMTQRRCSAWVGCFNMTFAPYVNISQLESMTYPISRYLRGAFIRG